MNIKYTKTSPQASAFPLYKKKTFKSGFRRIKIVTHISNYLSSKNTVY